jgi:tripartite-type tricarboxylate transporter receptor subunit TctC
MATELGRALKDASFAEHIEKAGAEPAADASPAEFSAFIAKEITLWGDAVKTAGVTLQ